MHHSAHDRFPSSYCANADDENAKSVMALPIRINFFMTRRRPTRATEISENFCAQLFFWLRCNWHWPGHCEKQ
jgi:hypothetical protein